MPLAWPILTTTNWAKLPLIDYLGGAIICESKNALLAKSELHCGYAPLFLLMLPLPCPCPKEQLATAQPWGPFAGSRSAVSGHC